MMAEIAVPEYAIEERFLAASGPGGAQRRQPRECLPSGRYDYRIGRRNR
jgi:hypothetical protein